MNFKIDERLKSNPGLQGERIKRRCKVCGGDAVFFDYVDFNKFCHAIDYYAHGVKFIPVPYFSCDTCEAIFTTFCDNWSQVEFSKYIYNDEYRFVDPDYLEKRPTETAAWFSNSMIGLKDKRFLDYGSGAGVFVEKMSTKGFNIEGFDPFSSPERPVGLFDIVTAFEVIEHSIDPLGTLKDMQSFLKPGGAIIFSQSLQPPTIKSIRGNWWYIAPRNGHVTTYSSATLAYLSKSAEMSFRVLMPNVLYGFLDATRGDTADRVKYAFGATQAFISLRAPLPTAESNKSHWNEVEGGKSTKKPFRWTAASRIDFGEYEFDVGETKIELPYILEIRGGLAQSAKFVIDTEVPTEVHGNKLRATLTSEKPHRSRIVLATDELTASDNPGDSRRLGLAIPI